MSAVPDQTALCLHPENPRYFLFRGRPRVLLCATEHYGSVLNRAFDFQRYLDDAVDKKQTLTRLFLLFRELQAARNPYSPCKPESPDYLAPWERTGPGQALDGEPEFIHGFDIVHARPAAEWIHLDLESVVVAGLCVPGQAYAAYIADGREVTDPGAGRQVSGAIQLDLPSGIYRISLYSPVSGLYSPAISLRGGQRQTVELAPFAHDIVIVATQSG